MISTWQHEARHELNTRRIRSSGWGYRSGQTPSVEPTVMACLALLASGDERTSPHDMEISHEAARWLAGVQRPDGSLHVTERSDSQNGWPTAHALLLWSVLTGYQAPLDRSQTWLLDRKGEIIPIDRSAKKVVGHDSRLVGWPWVDATHSWLEPTAMAILALCRVGLAGHPRVNAGVELILDRALGSGGWNYGNKSVFGTELRPQPGPTGLALLALAAGGARAPAVASGLRYLHQAVDDLRAPISLGWATLGLRAHQAVAAEADTSLARACRRCIDKPEAIMGLALVLLASSDRGLGLLVNVNPSSIPSPGPPAGGARPPNTSKERT